MSQKWVKNKFSKIVPKALGMLKQAFFAHFEPMVTRFGPSKIANRLGNGPFWDQKRVKNGSKRWFSKSDPGPLRVHKQVKGARFECVLTQFSPFYHMFQVVPFARTLEPYGGAT